MLRRLTPQAAIIATWALWHSAVIATNTTDLLKVWGLLPDDYMWISNNYAMFVGGGGGSGAVVALYAGGFVWHVAIAALLWRALIVGLRAPERVAELARAGFTAGIGFWGIFFVLTELSTAKTQPLLLGLFTGMVISWVAIELLDRSGRRAGSAD